MPQLCLCKNKTKMTSTMSKIYIPMQREVLSRSCVSTHYRSRTHLITPRPNVFLKPRTTQLRKRCNQSITTVAAASASLLLPMAASSGVVPPLLAGLALGTLAVANLVTTGRILGISGYLKSVVTGREVTAAYRWLFLAGLVAGGLTLHSFFPAALETLPIKEQVDGWLNLRLLAGGLLVGLGTALGNGCTSGHGICGNARLSVRSFVATLTFMFFGAVATAVAGTASLYNVPAGFVPLAEPSSSLLTLSKATLAASTLLLTGIIDLGDRIRQNEYVSGFIYHVSSLAIGYLFALGLGASGMLRPSKISGFLAVFAGSIDISLIFVMAGSLLVAIPGFQFASRHLTSPVCAREYNLSANKNIDLKLIAGAALFGVGWGLAGVCPGPGLALLGTDALPQIAQFVGATAVGMVLSSSVEKQIDAMGTQPKVSVA